MAESDQQQHDPAGLRQRAEALWRQQSADRRDTAYPGPDISLEKALSLLHELEVHQIELEMQNEELQRTQDELAVSRSRYFDLYDLAPVGYLTLSETGLIREANLTAANLLGLDRSQLVNQSLTRFIVPDDQDIYYLHCKRLFATQLPQVCELRMARKDAEPFWARMQAIWAPESNDAPLWRATLSDISEHKQAEEALRQAQKTQIVQTLHDTVLQMLFTIGLESKSCLMLPELPEIARTRLELIGRLAARSSEELRSAMLPLSIANLPVGTALLALLRESVRDFQERTGIATTLVVRDGFACPPSLIGEAIYRIVRESLSNARKHAQACAVIVSVQSTDASISVTIQDDGLGLAGPLTVENGEGGLHFGVVTMRQVASQAGGELVIANNDDQGVLVRATFPLPGSGHP